MEAVIRAKASAASAARRLFRNHVLKGSPANDRKEGVVEPEEPEVASRIARDARTDAADDDRDRERKEEQGQKELASPAGGGHRRKQRPNRGDADIGQNDAADHRAVHSTQEE